MARDAESEDSFGACAGCDILAGVTWSGTKSRIATGVPYVGVPAPLVPDQVSVSWFHTGARLVVELRSCSNL